jgi:hypothetical protein
MPNDERFLVIALNLFVFHRNQQAKSRTQTASPKTVENFDSAVERPERAVGGVKALRKIEIVAGVVA